MSSLFADTPALPVRSDREFLWWPTVRTENMEDVIRITRTISVRPDHNREDQLQRAIERKAGEKVVFWYSPDKGLTDFDKFKDFFQRYKLANGNRNPDYVVIDHETGDFFDDPYTMFHEAFTMKTYLDEQNVDPNTQIWYEYGSTDRAANSRGVQESAYASFPSYKTIPNCTVYRPWDFGRSEANLISAHTTALGEQNCANELDTVFAAWFMFGCGAWIADLYDDLGDGRTASRLDLDGVTEIWNPPVYPRKVAWRWGMLWWSHPHWYQTRQKRFGPTPRIQLGMYLDNERSTNKKGVNVSAQHFDAFCRGANGESL